jgi:DNA-binding NarL/FixJ family response regulator
MPDPEVSPPRLIRIAIIEDQDELRQGLAYLIDATEGFRCRQRFASMEEALEPISAEPPDIALIDIGLPGMSGIDGVRILKERLPNLLVLMLTVYKDDDRIFRAICAGACGYLLKKTPPARLVESLREAAEGGAPMSPEVARRVIELFRDFARRNRPRIISARRSDGCWNFSARGTITKQPPRRCRSACIP